MPANASLNGIAFHSGPSEVRWDYKMIVKDSKTLGGKVIQILGTDLGDMTLTGRFAPDERKGDREAWEEQMRWRDRIKKWTADVAADPKQTPMRFVYTPRNWDFNVYIKQFSGITHDIREIAPEFTITLHVLADGARAVVKDIEDLYIQRLMEGVGWKQTEYNGPSEEALATLIGSGTVGDYLAAQAQAAFEAGLQGGSPGA